MCYFQLMETKQRLVNRKQVSYPQKIICQNSAASGTVSTNLNNICNEASVVFSNIMIILIFKNNNLLKK